jgi:hypothetical protein
MGLRNVLALRREESHDSGVYAGVPVKQVKEGERDTSDGLSPKDLSLCYNTRDVKLPTGSYW